MKALLWLEEHARSQPRWVILSLAVTFVVGLAWLYLRARDRYIRLTVERTIGAIMQDRQVVRGLIDPQFAENWQEELTQSQTRMEERFRGFETEFTTEMHTALREMVTSARSSGVPLHVQVGSIREADLLREALGGNVEVRVSRRGARPQEAESPSTPAPSAPTTWDRLLADDEPEAPCPTTTTPNEPPKRKSRKKT